MPHDINSQQSFEALPSETKRSEKNTGTHDRIPPDPAISRHESPNGAPSEPSGTRHFHQIDGDKHQTDLRLGVREILEPPPLFNPSQQPPRDQPEVEEKMVLPVAEAARQDQAHSRRHSPRSDRPRPAAAAARHGSYASAPPRRSSDPRLSAATTAPAPPQAANRTRPPPRGRRSASSPLHASFALCRLARRAPPPPPAPAAAAAGGTAGSCGG